MAEAVAPIIDIATGQRIAAPAVAKPRRICEDERGRYIMVDGQRIPVRNGWRPGDQDPLEDWQTAREIAQDIANGDGLHIEPGKWLGSLLTVSTSVGGWTTYRCAPEPMVAAWLASLGVVWTPWSLWLTWHAAPLGGFPALAAAISFVGAPFLLWTRFCINHTELGRPRT
jgi:hypothetical protein